MKIQLSKANLARVDALCRALNSGRGDVIEGIFLEDQTILSRLKLAEQISKKVEPQSDDHVTIEVESAKIALVNPRLVEEKLLQKLGKDSTTTKTVSEDQTAAESAPHDESSITVAVHLTKATKDDLRVRADRSSRKTPGQIHAIIAEIIEFSAEEKQRLDEYLSEPRSEVIEKKVVRINRSEHEVLQEWAERSRRTLQDHLRHVIEKYLELNPLS